MTAARGESAREGADWRAAGKWLGAREGGLVGLLVRGGRDGLVRGGEGRASEKGHEIVRGTIEWGEKEGEWEVIWRSGEYKPSKRS